MAPPPLKRSLTLRARIALFVCAVGVLCVVVILTMRIRLGYQVSHQLEAIKGQGYPVSGEELNSWYRSVPENENAALYATS